jgi:alpha-glucosidase
MADWWQTGVIYQIYPRSFMDANGDGVGDLKGIENRLDHLVDLGVDALWISPFYPSPMKDFGYDVSDYTGVDPLFGSLADFEALRDAAHARGLKILLDFVPSHCSDAHPWFREACASRDARTRDWFVWSDPGADGGPPNNWISEFGGPAWTFEAETGQYYLHIFLSEQPSFNWYNPDLRAAIYDAMRVWFDRGVDGFRVDAVENMGPDPQFRDNPPNPAWIEAMGPARSLLGTYTKHQPVVLEIAREMRAVAQEYSPERLLVGEVYGSFDELMPYYGPAGDGFQLPFNFALIECDWAADTIAALVADYEAKLPAGAWPNWVLGNHDRARIATRAGPSQARVAAMLLLTLRGTPTLYQGDELGMESAVIPPEAVQDPWEINVPGQGLGRDPVRTPIPWEAGPGAGFTTHPHPWLPITVPAGGAVAEQAADPTSMLSFQRALLALRRAEPALHRGAYRALSTADGVLRYERSDGARRLQVALNMTDRPQPSRLTGTCLLDTAGRRSGAAPGTLAPGEGVIVVP